jgi:hypothetical protein
MSTLVTFLLAVCGDDAADNYRWIVSPDDPGRIYLYRGGVQQGGYDLDRHYYRPFDGAAWGAPCEPPLPPPCFGVARDKLPDGPRYLLNGRPIAAAEAHDIVERGLPDDEGKLRVTIIGPDELRRRVHREIEAHPAFASLRDSIAVRDYRPDHWSLQVGFVTTGQPTIYCQAPSGRVLHRQDDYAGGADAVVTAIRKAKDNYDPRRDPDLRRWFLSLLPLADLVRPLSLLAALALGLVVSRVVNR